LLYWLDSFEISDLATTAVNAAELRYGIARLPEGHRKRELTDRPIGVADAQIGLINLGNWAKPPSGSPRRPLKVSFVQVR
jgi:hypothetical protein